MSQPSGQSMNLRFLEYFTALCRERHFARAAEACSVTQPTLSAGITALEELLGKRLILRDRRFAGLTAEGEAMLPWAQRLLADHEALRQAVDAESGALKGELRLGVIPASMPAVGYLTRRIQLRNPELRLNVRSMTSREIERGLLEYELDAGLTYLHNAPLAQVTGMTLYHEYYRFAARADSALGQRQAVEWGEVAQLPICLLHRGMQNRRILDAHLMTRGLDIVPKVTADSYVTLLSLVEASGLYSILPHSYAALLPASGNVRLIDFVDPAPPNEIGLVVLEREPRSSMARAALVAARELASDGLFEDI
jgi:DNA-binding transcriptional LysR family regulator